ncbi:hypothetical protein JVW24_23760, partial [Vibrio cholerae O1]|nr:hypothetical protein [Vibrio cholerae O1]
ASLSSLESIVWIAGGLPKGADFTDLLSRHGQRLKSLVLIGADDTALRQAAIAAVPDLEIVRIDPNPADGPNDPTVA